MREGKSPLWREPSRSPWPPPYGGLEKTVREAWASAQAHLMRYPRIRRETPACWINQSERARAEGLLMRNANTGRDAALFREPHESVPMASHGC